MARCVIHDPGVRCAIGVPMKRSLYLLLLAFAPSLIPAQAAVPATLYDAANCKKFETAPLAYVFCDDGVPAAGGSTANATGALAITVPAEYDGDGYTGLPLQKLPTTVPGADAAGNIALDVDITWPTAAPPAAGYPMLFFMHGCCGGNKTGWESGNKDTAGAFAAGGEKWHYNNAWFASRGYVVVNYTARGFATNGPAGPGRAGSTGQTQIDSRRFEVNDFQSLACQIYANRSLWNTATGQTIAIKPDGIVITGGSYGGGLSWMALTDPVWTCNSDTGADGQVMKLAAVAPRFGWTDLVHSLVPTGRHSALPANLPKTDGCDSGGRKPDGSACDDAVPAGVPKQSINAGLYGTGLNGANFPSSIHEAQTCLTSSYPLEPNPGCANTLATTLPEFLADRSAYYQQQWFDKIVTDASYRIPIFSAGTLTDPLFPPIEHRRMHNRILSLVPDYPLQAYFGDYQHFVQNKATEWGDLCAGTARHVCTDADFAGDFNAPPDTIVRTGITTRLNRFIDHYARPAGNPDAPAPARDVTAALQVCPQKGATATEDSEPGLTFTAATFEALANGATVFDTTAGTLTAGSTGSSTTSSAGGGTHADPVATSQMTNKCSTRIATDPAPAGVVQLTTPALPRDLIMLGAGTLTVAFSSSGDAASQQLNARLYEVLPDNSAVMADRGFRRLSAAEVAAGTISFELFGNGWMFSQGNRIRLELMQDDAPYLKASQPPSGLTLGRVSLSLPTRSTTSGSGGPGSGPRDSGGSGALALGLLASLLGLAGLRARRRL